MGVGSARKRSDVRAVLEAVADEYSKSWENAARGDLDPAHRAHPCLAALKDVQRTFARM